MKTKIILILSTLFLVACECGVKVDLVDDESKQWMIDICEDKKGIYSSKIIDGNILQIYCIQGNEKHYKIVTFKQEQEINLPIKIQQTIEVENKSLEDLIQPYR